MSRKTLLAFSLIVATLVLAGCADFNTPYGGGYNDPYYPPPPRNDGYYGRRDYDHYKHEKRELERERDRLEEERERLEREREKASRPPPPPPPPRREERCPSGFSPSERKCSKEERRRGCQDMRLPGGLGCVRR